MHQLVKYLCWHGLILSGLYSCNLFAAAPAAGPLRIAIVGDINGSYGSSEYPPLSLVLRDKVLALKPDLVLSNGDVVAGQKTSFSQQTLQLMWHSFDRQFRQPVSDAGSVWLPALGNHDGSKALSPLGQYLFAAERQQTAVYWQQNTPKHSALLWLDKQHYPFYYSVRWQDTALLIVDASGSDMSDTEWQWLEQQLRSPAFSQANTRIVVGHLPIFAVAQGREAPGERLANSEKLLKLFSLHQVDWYISGHQHAYYLAKIKQLNLLMAGGIPARPLLGQTRGISTLTLMTLSPQTQIHSWDLQSDAEIKLEQLPQSIPAHPFTLQRWPTSSSRPCTLQHQQDLTC